MELWLSDSLSLTISGTELNFQYLRRILDADLHMSLIQEPPQNGLFSLISIALSIAK